MLLSHRPKRADVVLFKELLGHLGHKRNRAGIRAADRARFSLVGARTAIRVLPTCKRQQGTEGVGGVPVLARPSFACRLCVETGEGAVVLPLAFQGGRGRDGGTYLSHAAPSSCASPPLCANGRGGCGGGGLSHMHVSCLCMNEGGMGGIPVAPPFPCSRVNRGGGGRGQCLGLLFDMNRDEGENGGIPVLHPHCVRKWGQGAKGGKGGACHLHSPPLRVNWGRGAMGGLSRVVPRLHVVYRVGKGGPKDVEGLRAERGG
ncbi:hypothetical protein EDB83DRAFT_2325107 [Lactarius deliciosus]|nr:hypothetical protein EDB83DRAFT_2325107 [Lactarius deliciosus]